MCIEMTKILVLDDHPLYREGVITALSAPPLRAQVLGVSSTDDAIKLLDTDPSFELALVDLKLRNEDGLEALRQIGSRYPTVARVLISGESSPGLAAAAMRCGAQGFLRKSLSIREMAAALTEVLRGGTCWPVEREERTFGTPQPFGREVRAPEQSLTSRQLQALALLGQGKSNAQIAAELGITERTVKAHLSGVFDVLGVNTRVGAVVRAKALGLVA
jgi:DNA-binding NarL/FixJ family response regulator